MPKDQGSVVSTNTECKSLAVSILAKHIIPVIKDEQF